MLDEKKTKKQLIDEIKSLREHLASLQGGQSPHKNSDITIPKKLAWKDFLLGLQEKSCDFTDEALYRYILDEVVRLTKSDIGFLHLVSEDQQSVIPACCHEKALQHCTASHETHYPIDQAGNWADCLHLKRPVVHNDFSQAPNRKGLPPGHNPILRFMGIPVIEQGKVRFILGVGNKSEEYDDEDVFQTQLVVNNLQSILTRRRVEKQLRENEERLFLSLQATQDAIWDWDIVQGTGYASPNYFTMLGYKPDEFLMNSEYWWQLIHWKDAQKVREAMDRVMNNPESWQDSIPNVEFRMRKKTGEWRWILARGKVVTWDREGRPLRMMGTHTDITDRKLAEEALRESEQRYRTLFETANDAILLVDRDFIYVDCNSKAMEMTQRSRSEIIGHNAYEDSPLVQPDGNNSQAAALSYINEAVSGRPQKFYWQSLRKDRTPLDTDISLNRLTLGGKHYLQIIARDVTERKAAEAALRANEILRNRLFESSVMPIILMDSVTYRFIDCNAMAAAIYGFTSIEETLGKTPLDVSATLQNDGTPSLEKAHYYINRALNEGFVVFEWCHQRPDGLQWEAEVHLRRFTSGDAILLQFTLIDITDRKLAEEALRESESKFKDLVEQSIVGVYLIQDGLFKYVNAKFAEIFGYGIDEMTDKMGAKDVVFADDFPLVEKNIDRRISGELKDINYDFRIVTKTGEIRYIEVYSSRTTYRGRTALIGTLLDLTERRQMVEALRQNEATLRSVFNASPIGLCTMKGRVFQSANKAWYDLFGYTEAEIIDHTTRMLYENDGEYERVGRELYENLKDRGLASVQTRIRRKDGVLRDVVVTAAPLEREYLFHGTVVTIEDITDRKQADAELQYRNTLLTTQLEASMDGILVVDETGRMIFFNQRFVKMWRIPDEVVASRSDARALQSIRVLLEDPDSYIDKVNYLHAHRDETSRDDVCLRDGRSFDRYSAPVVGNDGCYYGRIWQFRDMTEYKQAQEDLRKSEAAYREIFNAVSEAIFIHDLCTGDIVDVNSSMLEMFGYDREEARRLRVGDVSSGKIPYTQEMADELIAKAAGGEPQVFEWCGRRKNGQLFPEEISLKKGVIAGQVCVLAVVRDITERKQAEEALRDSERRLNDVIDFLPDATLVIDRYGKVQAWNRAMETMTGVKKEDMLGKGGYEYALPFYGTRRPILIDLVLHQDEAVENQYVTIRRFGDALFAETRAPNLPPGDVILAATASVLRDSDGEFIAAIECIRDVTHQTLLESKLRQAQKMEAIGTLAGGIAHDFNNILASTIGYTELAIMNIGKPNLLKGYLEQVMKACDRAKNLVNQILVFSRQREQERKPVDMTVIVKEALKLLRASLPSTIKINHHFPAEPATVLADPTQIHQIVMNLCTNAAQAMRENGGELDVNLSHISVSTTMAEVNPLFKAGAYVQLVVKDTGHGIDPAIIDKIFDPFFTTKRHQEGTGLGLSVVYGIVNSYDGVVQVTSELGQGTIFNVYIPAIEEIKVAVEQKITQPIPGGTESLLLVDDEELLVQAMENYLGALGYDVVSYTNSPEALYIVQENPCRFDLMITDMTMPHMTGLKLSREVLAINPLMPVILCTGYNASITEDEVKRSGIKEFVLKPVSLQKMAYLIRQVLDMQ